MLAVSDPREGLPPCIKQYVEAENRAAAFFDDSVCGHGDGDKRYLRYGVSAGVIQERRRDRAHPNCFGATLRAPAPIYLLTDDPDEAQAAFERGAEWVRTGQMA